MLNATATIKKLRAVDWTGQKMAEVNGDGIPPDTTVGEVLAEMVRIMRLPKNTPYAGYYQDKKLARGETLAEAGIEDDAEIRIAPEVTAG